MFRHIAVFTALCCVLIPSVLMAQSASMRHDVIHQRNGERRRGIVTREEREWIYFRTFAAQREEQRVRTANVVRIVYYGMTQDGQWSSGRSMMSAGQYALAAARFADMASTGDHRWHKTYGYFNSGDAWEQAGEYQQAAEMFGLLVSEFPDDRMYLDALYRQGINLARAQKFDEAEAVVALINTYYEQNHRERRALARAEAVRAAIFGEQGIMGRAREHEGRAGLQTSSPYSFENESPPYFHWNLYWAGLLRRQGEYGAAALVYRRLLNEIRGDSGLMVQLSLGLGICLANDNEREAALFELLKLDALPYGGAEQRAKAHYWIGRLKWETAQQVLDDPSAGDNQAEFARLKAGLAREYLAAVAGNAAAGAFAERAASLIETLPPDPDKVTEEDEGGT